MSQTFTAEELAHYDGKDGKPVYLALRGQVFDVSEGRSFYGPGGPYEAFAGKECSRALALMKIDAAECNDNLEGLDDKCLQTLQDWTKKFTQKYKIVGQVASH
mmetsp:Transcript_13828/g.34016  ORF Transcript_13828/g.34016 Transcript_13828/m.34016 type:complete len:103 (-) Transcript_13828:392-700(-)